jgi:uncharacterized membrane protein YphA (DoxX/SURF4 family)
VAAAARAFAHAHPPRKPCIAEYGREFPAFLAGFDGATGWPALASFGELEWAVGQASIAVDAPPLSWPTIGSVGAERLAVARLVLQPGLAYLDSRWRVDDVMRSYLRGEAPHAPSAYDTFIEIRGARGELKLTRLDRATYAFRAALESATIGEAAERALDRDGDFDAGAALRALVTAGLVTAVRAERDEYQVPLLEPELAARLATAVELGAPLLLFAGLGTRLATLPLLGMITVIQIFVYPNAWGDHLMWGSTLLFLLTRGPGVFSVDHALAAWTAKRAPATV